MRNIVLVLVMMAGCEPYTQVQIDLLTQARRGIAQSQQSLDQKSRIITAYYALQRNRLDEAFDADVRGRGPALSGDWVIEARKAYGAALSALDAARAAGAAADETDRRNLAAIDQALQQTLWLQSIQLRYTSLPKEIINEHN